MKLVYTATGKPVEIGDRHTVQGFEIVVDHAPRPHKPDSEGRITFTMPDGTSGPTYYCSVIDAEWIEREDRPWAAFNKAGHVCPDTGRIAMTVADAYARDDSPDRHFWKWDKDADYAGLDPWRQIDGMDASTSNGPDGRPAVYTLDWANGGSTSVQPAAIVYMQRTTVERALR